MRIDLSHTIENDLVTYKGLPAPVICDYLSREESKLLYADGTTFQIAKIEMVSNTGTYLDCPFHRYENGADLSELPLDRLADLEAITVRSPYTARKAIDAEIFHQHDVDGKAVLVHTGWDVHWNTVVYYDDHPYLTAEAAEYLKNRNVLLVGVDSHNIDNTRTKFRPVHTILLGHGILIVEHLCNLSLVPDIGFLFSALPPKFKGVGTFPVRAFAKTV